MSIKFASQSVNQAEYLVADYTSAPRLSGKPVSVTLWLYLENAPTGGDTWTIWWFGEKDATGNHLVLEAVAGASNTVDLRASLVGQTTLGPATKAGVSTEAWHCVSVVVEAGQAQGSTMVTLYVDDDTSPPSDSDTIAGISYATWDTFALAANLSSGVDDLGLFLAEQVAIWSTALGQYDTPTMYSEKKPPWDMSPSPDFGYWVAAGHARAGIPVDSDKTWDRDSGDLYNQSTPTGQPRLPQLDLLPETTPPTWRAATPAMLYASSATIVPVDRTPPRDPSRLQPSFAFFNGPQPQQNGDPPIPGEKIRELAYYHDPNMSAYCASDYTGSEQITPPYTDDDPPDYFPKGDIAQIARRMADWFEIQNFKAGTGVGPGNNYAGVIYLRGIGEHAENDKKTQLNGRLAKTRRVRGGEERVFGGAGVRIPLEEHPLDWVLDDDSPWIEAPWSCWYRQNGVELVGEYMEHFWIALKQELDDRGLCYPLRAHWDYEGWPRDSNQLRFDQASYAIDKQIGCWDDVAADARYSTEDLLNYAGSTISSFIGSVTYDDEAGINDTANYAFWQWWHAYSVAVRMEAVARSTMATLKTHFPYCQWSNYRAFTADNENFLYPEGQDAPSTPRWFNTPTQFDNADYAPQADYSAPVLYSLPNALNNLLGAYGERVGYTISEVVRDFNIMRVDASANSIASLPLAPWIEDVGHTFYKENSSGRVLYDYAITVEDSKALLGHLWRRGCNEFIMFQFNEYIDTYPDKIAACQWLRDWVHSIPQARQDRVGRVSRLGRRGM
ncbi:MAG: hypothetical protein ACIAS6_05380 [Phycisphaerales bacterium JB060]